MKKIHLNLETLEERALFAGAHEVAEAADICQLEDALSGDLDASSSSESACYGFMGTLGQYASAFGEMLEAPGKWIQETGDSVYTSFDTPPEYPEGGIYRDPASQGLAMFGSMVGGMGAISGALFNVTGTISELGESLTSLGDEEGNIVSAPFSLAKGLSYGVASLFEGVSSFGYNFYENNTYALPYQQFVDDHHAAFSTQAGSALGSGISFVGAALRAPGWVLHQAGDSLVKVCDIADATSNFVKDTYASVHSTYEYYFPSSSESSSKDACDLDNMDNLFQHIALRPAHAVVTSLA